MRASSTTKVILILTLLINTLIYFHFISRVKNSKPGAKIGNGNPQFIEVKIVCYMASWAINRPGDGRFEPADLDPHLCTHVIYAFATLNRHKLAPAKGTEEKYREVISLKEKNPNLKILLALGGWAMGTIPFKKLTSNSYRRNHFVQSAVEFLRKHRFDGLDIDWEYPSGAIDRANYLSLIKELMTEFINEAKYSTRSRLLLTAAVPGGHEAIVAGYEVSRIIDWIDFFNIMTYDFHGQWEKTVNHHSPLNPVGEGLLSVNSSAKDWLKQGAERRKLMIGMPTYGRTFTLASEKNFTIGSEAVRGGEPGNYTGESGFLSYYEICNFLKKHKTKLVRDSKQELPFAFNGNQWVGFDDEKSLKVKMDWIRKMHFGGIMIWSVDLDDFKGLCGNGKFPLIKSMKEELKSHKLGITGFQVSRNYYSDQ